jgi:arylsulfatase A-like enzyme
VRFENYFCTSPVCSPARASLLTGTIPSRHGVHDWLKAGNTTIESGRGGILVEYLRDSVGYSDILAANGYVCGLSGKWHLGDSHHAQKGFDYWAAHATGGGPYYQAPMIREGEVYRESGYVTDVITDNALAFLNRERHSGNPFYLGIHYTAPHSPWERDQHPDELYDVYLKGCPFESVPDVALHPWQRDHPTLIRRDKSNRRAILSGYFAAVTAMDANVARVLDWLEAEEVRENTLIFFTSDNGMNMGHHGVYGKGNGTYPQNMYDTSVKVPAILSRPGHLPEGIVEAGLFSHYDFMPTLLDYLDIENPVAAELPGRSFADLVRGREVGERENVVVYDEYGPVRMIRNREHKYIHRYPGGPCELYDLENDPRETTNLVNDAGRRVVVRRMKREMEDWFSRYADPALDGKRLPVVGTGQLGPVDPACDNETNFAAMPALLRGGPR